MRRDPILIISALLAPLGSLVGNGIYAGPPGNDQEVLAAVRAGLPTRGYVALTLELLGFAATAVLLAWLVVHLARRAPLSAATTGLAGAALIAVKVGSAAPVMAAFALADKLDAPTVALLFNLNGAAFVVEGFFVGLALGAAGLGLLRTDAPRWLAWWPAVVGPLGVLASIAGVLDEEWYAPIPFLLLLVWMLALAIRSAMSSDAAAGSADNAALAATMGA